MIDQSVMATMLARAYGFARLSPDKSSQNAALLGQELKGAPLELISSGYNHFYKGIPDAQENRDLKMERIEHAERDSIYMAARMGRCTTGAIMFCPWVACRECARAMIGSGIAGVVYHRQRNHLTPDRWKDSVEESLSWLKEAGIWLYAYNGPIQANPILISGKLWSPSECAYV